MVVTASGGKLTRAQASGTWDKTIYPYGRKLGLLTGYVKPQEGSSKRTAAGDEKLQENWYAVITELLNQIRTHAKQILKDDDLVEKMLPSLLVNLDEECLHALGKNAKIAGSTSKKKHDNQNASSRHAPIFPKMPTHLVFEAISFNNLCHASY